LPEEGLAVPSKAIVLLLEAGLTLAVWWAVQPETEKRIMRAAFWRGMERASMTVAKKASNVAAKSMEHYKETVSS
jgi:hypothetical protein